MEMLTKEERKTAMEGYKFQCRKKKNRWGDDHYIKYFYFPIPVSLYNTFKGRTLRPLTSSESHCNIDILIVFTTERKKDGTVSPVLRLTQELIPAPGDKLTKDDEEALLLLETVMAYVAERTKEVEEQRKSQQRRDLRQIIGSAMGREIEKRISENQEYKKLLKERDLFEKKRNDAIKKMERIHDESKRQIVKDIYKEMHKKGTLEYDRFLDLMCGEKYPEDITKEVIEEYRPLTQKETEEMEKLQKMNRVTVVNS